MNTLQKPLEDVVIESQGSVLTITWNRPGALNALTPAMLDAAADAVESLDPDTRLVVVTGVGRAYSSGAAIDPAINGDDTLVAAARLTKALVAVDVPVLAAVNGLVAGVAIPVVLAADISIAPSSAYLLPAFVNIGLIPDGGALALTAAAVGRTRVTELAMLGERLPADEAARVGLITRSVADADWAEAVAAMRARLASGPTLAYREMKGIIRDATLADFDSAVDAETTGQRRLFGTADQLEGMTAFAERRATHFVGR